MINIDMATKTLNDSLVCELRVNRRLRDELLNLAYSWYEEVQKIAAFLCGNKTNQTKQSVVKECNAFFTVSHTIHGSFDKALEGKPVAAHLKAIFLTCKLEVLRRIAVLKLQVLRSL